MAEYYEVESITKDNLVIESRDDEEIILAAGQNRVRGSLLGKTLIQLDTTTYIGTGNGVLSGEALKGKALKGDYKVTCIEVITDGGRFQVTDPNGNALGDVLVGVAYSNEHLGLAIADGATDFVLGDEFIIPVIDATDLHYILSLAAAVDGSQNPTHILGKDTDATAAAVNTWGYTGGIFYGDEMIFGVGHTAASVKEELKDIGISLK